MERALAPAEGGARHPPARASTSRSGSRAGPRRCSSGCPPALLTRDQLRMLEGPDNVVTDGGASMRRLGLGDLVALDEQLRRARCLKTS